MHSSKFYYEDLLGINPAEVYISTRNLSHQSCLSNKPHQLIGLLAVFFQNYLCESADKSQEKNTKTYQ